MARAKVLHTMSVAVPLGITPNQLITVLGNTHTHEDLREFTLINGFVNTRDNLLELTFTFDTTATYYGSAVRA